MDTWPAFLPDLALCFFLISRTVKFCFGFQSISVPVASVSAGAFSSNRSGDTMYVFLNSYRFKRTHNKCINMIKMY